MNPIAHRFTMPPRYAAVVCGNGLLLIAASGADVILGTTSAQPLALVTVVASVLGLAVLLVATLDLPAPERLRQLVFRLRYVVLATAATLTIDTLAIFATILVILVATPPSLAYSSDVIAFTSHDATLTLSGQNPYTSDDQFTSLLRQYPHIRPTPLRHGAFGTGDVYPSDVAVAREAQQYVNAPQATAGEFDPRTLHSYPALSFLLYVPFLSLGGQNIVWFQIAAYLALLVWLVSLAPPGLRRWSILAATSAVTVLGYSVLIDNEGICIAFVLLAWHFRDRRWVSSALLGLGCAFKQYCWFVVPIFIVESLMARGPKETLKRGAITLAAFLVPNLPYILSSPGAWWSSLWLPMTDPMFPMGMGFIAPSLGHLAPFAPAAFYSVLEALALAGAVWCQVRWRTVLGDGVLLLALVPLLFAFRSSINYFTVASLLALYAVNICYRLREHTLPDLPAQRTPAFAGA